jgi:hypothetical protein
MPSIHEFDVALNPGVTLPVSATRSMAREAHINAWTAGSKGQGPPMNVGTSAISGTTGLVLGLSRPTVAMANAPSEIVLGDTKAAPGILNLAEVFGTDANSVVIINFNIIAIP